MKHLAHTLSTFQQNQKTYLNESIAYLYTCVCVSIRCGDSKIHFLTNIYNQLCKP